MFRKAGVARVWGEEESRDEIKEIGKGKITQGLVNQAMISTVEGFGGF